MRLRRAVPLFLVAIIVAACSSDLPTTPGLISPEGSALMTEDPTLLEVGICKTWLGETPVPDIDWQFEWTATAAPTAGTTTVSIPADGRISNCVNLGFWPAGTDVTVTEIVPDGYFLELIVLQRRGGGADNITDTDPPTVTFSVDTYSTVIFKNDKLDIPPPPVGTQGCTPGFWRQPHHFDQWVGYAPGDSYASVFGVDRSGSLLDNVTARGGGENALARHSVAALLNASSPDVEYNLTVAQVIAAVQDAFATGEFEATKDELEGFNEQGCPL